MGREVPVGADQEDAVTQMRIRSVKGEFWDDQKVTAWSPLARLIYIGLWSLSDDCGRFQADLSSIHAALARKDRLVEVEKAFQEIVSAQKVELYEHDGETFGVVANWWHQKIDKPNQPVRPCPPEDVCMKIIEKSRNNARFRVHQEATLRRMFDDASPNVRRMFDDASRATRARAQDQGSGIRDHTPQPPVGGSSESLLRFHQDLTSMVCGESKRRLLETLTLAGLAQVVAGWPGWEAWTGAVLTEVENSNEPRIANPVVWLSARFGSVMKKKDAPDSASEEPRSVFRGPQSMT